MNTSTFDEVNYGETDSTCRSLNFNSCIYPSAAASTIYEITLNSTSSISIGSQQTDERE